MRSSLSTAQMRFAAIVTSFATVVAVAGFTSLASIASAETGGPTVSLTSSCSTATNSSPITVTATFSENIEQFNASNVSVSGGTAGNFSTTTADTVFTFDVTPTAEGAVSVSIPENFASSTASSTGNQASSVLNCTYDTTAPNISGIGVSGIGSTSATVNFTTDEPTTATVNFGLTAGYGSTASSSVSATTTHSIGLSGLSSGATYHFQIQATDVAGNAASTTDDTFNALALAPTISNIMVTVNGTSSATISWNTDVPATGFLSYGTTTSYSATTTTEVTASTTHSVTLNNLSEATTYHFQISESTSGGTTLSSDQTFMTTSTSATTPLAINGIDTVDSSAVADNLFEDGWKWLIHFTVPDNENAFRIRFSDWGNASSSFPANGNIRLSIAQASNASTTSSGIIATGNGYSDWFYLTGDTAASTAGRQVDLSVEVKVPFGTPTGSYTSNFTAQTFPSTSTSTAPSTP